MTVSDNDLLLQANQLGPVLGPAMIGWVMDKSEQQATELSNLRRGFIPVPLANLTQEDGTALEKLAATASGYSQISNKEVVLAIPVNATIEAFSFSVPVPLDVDTGEDMAVKVLASKVEGGTADALTLNLEAYFCGAGDLQNADAYAGAAKAVVTAGTILSYPLLAATIIKPGSLSCVLTLGGTNDADAVYIHSIWIEYTKS
jgi:hypothetical protein